MNFKKLAFIPLFLIALSFLVFKTSQIISSADFIFSFSLDKYLELIYLTLLIFISSFLFILISSFAQKSFSIILITSVLASAIPFFFLDFNKALIFAGGIFLSLNLSFITLQGKLKTYLTFDANLLMSPSVKNLASFLIIIISLIFYLGINQKIKEEGFSIPDPLIEAAINFSSPTSQVKGVKYLAQAPQLTPEHIQFLRENPQLLEQYGYSASDLENVQEIQEEQPISPPANTQQPESGQSNELIKNLVKNQVNKALEPYMDWIPLFLSLFLFISLYSLLKLVSIFLPLLIFTTFKILEKTGFVKFEKEMREAKRLVV